MQDSPTPGRPAGTGVTVACDERVVFTSAQVLAYPLQLMVDLFEIGPRGPADTYPRTALVHRVVGRGDRSPAPSGTQAR